MGSLDSTGFRLNAKDETMGAYDSDAELFSRWREGRADAGSALVRRHFRALHLFFTGKAVGHVEDLVQQTFMACVEAKDAYRGEASFRAYLFGMARLQLLTHYRKSKRHVLIDLTTSSLRDLGVSPSGMLAEQQGRNLLAAALQHLPIDQQIALELSYWEELTAAEVAHVLGVAENTVYSRLHRAKENLRRVLDELQPQGADGRTVLRQLERTR